MRRSKRILDLTLGSIGLLFVSPALATIAVVILLDDGRPLFFRQERVGRGGKPFRIWKFRTMRHGAGGPLLTTDTDSRVTRTGRWLRRTKLDELPQLINVVRGEMSLVGPRPEVERYVSHYTADQRRVLALVPGITDPASYRYWNESELLGRVDDPEQFYIQQIMPEKIRLNLSYAENATLWTDLVEIGRSCRTFLAGSCLR